MTYDALRQLLDDIKPGSLTYKTEKMLLRAIIDKLEAVQDDIPGNPAVLLLETELNDSQIKTLPTTPVELVPSPGVGKYLEIISVTLISDFAAVYTNVGGANTFITPVYGNSNEFMTYLVAADITSFLGSTTDRYRKFTPLNSVNSFGGGPVTTNLNVTTNQALKLMMDNGGAGNVTGGNAANVIRVKTLYAIPNI